MTLIETFTDMARRNPARLVFPESKDGRILQAVKKIYDMGIAQPILVGERELINESSSELGIDLSGISFRSNQEESVLDEYADMYMESRPVSKSIARRLVKKPLSFGGMMVKAGEADGMIAGVANATASVIQAAALTIGFSPGMSAPSSFFIMVLPEFYGHKNCPLIFADCAVNIDPSPEELAEIAVASGYNAKNLLGVEPHIALLSFATRGSANHSRVDKVRKAVDLAKVMAPDLKIDGELQGDAAIVEAVAGKKATGSEVAGKANVLVFPDLDSGNIAYKLVQYIGKAQAIGPILQGFACPVNDLSRGASVDDLVAVAAITSVQAQKTKSKVES